MRKKIHQEILQDRFFSWLKLKSYRLIKRLEDTDNPKGVSADNYKRKKGQGLLKRQINDTQRNSK